MSDDLVDSDSSVSVGRQKATLDVPSPYTKLELGAGTYDGATVNTVKHVRMYAHGTAVNSGAIAIATGQVWAQSMADAVVLSANKSVMAGKERSYVTAAQGVTVLAGFKPSTVGSEGTPGELPEGVEDYTKAANTALGVWSGFSAAMFAMNGAVGVVEGLLGHASAGFMAKSVAANIAATTGAFTAMCSSKNNPFPGVNLFSQGGTHVGCSYSCVYLAGLMGVQMATPFMNTFALFNTRLRGYKRTSVTSCGSVDMSSLFGFSVLAPDDVTVSARLGNCNVFGPKNVVIGTPNTTTDPWPLTVTGKIFWFKEVTLPNPQLPTMNVSVNGVNASTVNAAEGVSLFLDNVSPLAMVPPLAPRIKVSAAVDVDVKAQMDVELYSDKRALVLDQMAVRLTASMRGGGGGGGVAAVLLAASGVAANNQSPALSLRTPIGGPAATLSGPRGGGEVVCEMDGITFSHANQPIFVISPDGVQIDAMEVSLK